MQQNWIVGFIRRLKFPGWSVPAALLAVLAACFIPFIHQQGFYWDDWAKTLVHRLYGPAGYWSYYAGDRPLSGWTHIVLLTVLGETPLNWQIFTLAMRWLSSVAMWWSLGLMWPNHKRPLALAALLFAVYPVFDQQPIAVTYHQQWMQFALYFLSLGLMIMAVQTQGRLRRMALLTSASIIVMLIQVTVTEYFVPLELLRPILIWIICVDHKRAQRWRLTLLRYLPYFGVLSLYLVWRFFLMELPGSDPYAPVLVDKLLQNPIATLLESGQAILVDLAAIFITVWSPVFSLSLDVSSGFTLTVIGLTIAFTILLVIYLQGFEATDDENQTWIQQALLVGVLATLLGALPGWAIGRRVIDDFHSNRYALAAMFGASLLLVALLEVFLKARLQKVVVVAALVGLSINFHIHTGRYYGDIWSQQLDLYWQFTWRAPFVEQPTALIFENEPLPDQGLFSISSAFNFLYPQPADADRISYYVYTLRPRYDNNIPDISTISFNTTFRSLHYQGAPPDTLLIHYDPGNANCLWVLSEENAGDPYLSELIDAMLPISNLERILPQKAAQTYPPAEVFGPEPSGTWCSYYQKAALAVQFEDWITAAELGDAARKIGYTPESLPIEAPHEWMPFISGYAYSGRWDEAAELTIQAADMRYRVYDESLCRLWDQIAASTEKSRDKDTARTHVSQTLTCTGESE